MITCKRCCSEKVRIAHARGFWETLQTILGIHPFRCSGCDHRFSASVWLVRKLPFAKCPRCLRTGNLTGWSTRHFKPSLQMEIQMALGAQRYRCGACRCNFVSFRPKKEIVITAKTQWEQAAKVGTATSATGDALLNLNNALFEEEKALGKDKERSVALALKDTPDSSGQTAPVSSQPKSRPQKEEGSE